MAWVNQLRERGLRLTADGEVLLVEPRSALTDELRALIRANKIAILRELAGAAERLITGLPAHFSAALECGRLNNCRACVHFRARVGDQPDGWCATFHTETWSQVPFHCGGYIARRQ